MKKFKIYSNITGKSMTIVEASNYCYNGDSIEFYNTTQYNGRLVVAVISSKYQSFEVY